jgi:hypothetical protein
MRADSRALLTSVLLTIRVGLLAFEAEDGGTTVSILFKDIPPGIRPEDNEAGTRATLERLARYVE